MQKLFADFGAAESAQIYEKLRSHMQKYANFRLDKVLKLDISPLTVARLSALRNSLVFWRIL